MNEKTKKIVLAALFSALTFTATIIITIPMPVIGYINLGDCFVLLSGWVLGSVYGALSAGIGSAVADLSSGFVSYAPATFVIKFIMAVVSYTIGNKISKGGKFSVMKIISAVAAEVCMICGYLIFESFLYGFGTASLNIVFNAVQGAIGLIAGLILLKVYNKFIAPMFNSPHSKV